MSADYNPQTKIDVLVAYCKSKGSSLHAELRLTFALKVSHSIPSYQSIKVNQPSKSIHRSIHVHSCFLSFCVQDAYSANDNCDSLLSLLSPSFSTASKTQRQWLIGDPRQLPESPTSTDKQASPSLVWRIRQINLTYTERAIRDNGSFSTRPNNGVIDTMTRKNACLWISIQQGLSSLNVVFDAQAFCKKSKIGSGSFFNADNKNHSNALQEVCELHNLTINMYMVRSEGLDKSSWIDKSDAPLFIYKPKQSSTRKKKKPVALALAYWLNQHFELITSETPTSKPLDLDSDCDTEYHQYLHSTTQWHQRAPQKVIHPSVPIDDQPTQLPCIYPINRPCFRLSTLLMCDA
jgi:hypothetical protein